ncbi:MAG: polysaccharide biosynthesis tyrosine autokinase [Arhodomonas sp.]|nr:polysaccharide biosynthesis tyrosine autokinase [Arhodomonas sp.]
MASEDDRDDRHHELQRYEGHYPTERTGGRALAQPGGMVPPEYADDEFSLADLWLTIRKHKWTIISFTALVVTATVVATALMRPVYKATATVQINEQGSQILEYQDLEGSGGGSQGRNFYSTQYQILQSRSLASRVVDELGLVDNPELNGEVSQRGLMAGIGQVRQVISQVFADDGEPAVEEAPASREDRRAAVVNRLRSKLSVNPVGDSRLVEVSFESFDPELAAEVSNALVDNYIEANLERDYESGSDAREFLQGQLADMQAKLERADQRLQDFAKERGIADLDSRIELANDKLGQLETKLTEVQQDKLATKVKYDRIQNGNGDSLPEIVNNEVLNALEQKLVEHRSQYSELSGKFKPDYPRMVELQNRITELEEQIAQEKERIKESIISRHEGLVEQEEAIKESIQAQEQQLLTLNQRGVQYNILKREVETNEELYNGLLQRMKEIGVAAGVKENNISVIDEARAPGGPFKPNMSLNASLALVLGVFGGTGIAFLLQFLDNTVRRPEDLEQIAHLPSLGLVPRAKKGRGRRAADVEADELAFYSITQPQSEVSEAFRSLRTSLMFSSPEGMPGRLLITSPGAGEGKTTAATNMACVLAQNGERVLLVDADLRKPRMHRIFDITQVPGLTERIARRNLAGMNCIHPTNVRNLYVLPSGTVPPNPAELLAPERLRAVLDDVGELFDHIVIDSAPVLGLADALVLSRSADGVVLIACGGKTTKESLRYAAGRLRQVRAPLLGGALNAVDLSSPDYNYYTSNYYYAYGESGDGGAGLPARAENATRRGGGPDGA